ncbi:hypothetical protein IEQ34_019960 [Dendrobium chrysotoxum]|uniref:Alpha-ketoglutarate-dependent dioxygenase AlkB-like domain-containing protein n=1 Tax=Dendrobium chrysotoxum TaxID=161865 RepID=A0AAV7G8W9_DENCH|nr:hypothetical protein IEQ34_019960 [Dendrobium chrysotoxum]
MLPVCNILLRRLPVRKQPAYAPSLWFVRKSPQAEDPLLSTSSIRTSGLDAAMSFRLRGFEATKLNPNLDANSCEKRGKQSITDLSDGSEVVYVPRVLSAKRAWAWFDYLDKEIPWTRPLIHVFGRSCLQPRGSCYVASEGLTALKYSGYQPHVYTWDEYPVLRDILQAVHEALPGTRFNSLLLNRYKHDSDYIAWHSDDEKLYGSTPKNCVGFFWM